MAAYTPERMLITGGAGFIGSAYVRMALAARPERQVVILDALTYAGTLANLEDVLDQPRLAFVHGDITDAGTVARCLDGADTVVNFAAESHVDRSIQAAGAFVQTNVAGVQVLLDASLRAGVRRVVHISTDEVYGDIAQGFSQEDDPLLPRSPYAASKAGGELLARSYWTTHGLDVLVTRGSNTFGPRQHPEKFIPLCITNALQALPVPIYGDGLQVRDWLFVDDHCTGIERVLGYGTPGQAYNIGGGHPQRNLETAHQILRLCERDADLVQHVTDRKGHDRRYAVACARIQALGWQPAHTFSQDLARTVAWYREHDAWWRTIRSSDAFSAHYQRTYAPATLSTRGAGDAG